MFESFPTLPSVSITIQELKYTVPVVGLGHLGVKQLILWLQVSGTSFLLFPGTQHGQRYST